MFNRKGFITLEAIFYIITSFFILIMINAATMYIANFKPNYRVKVYQSINQLKKSLIKYDKINKFSNNEIILNDYVKIKINKDQIYETPGYMPYLQGIENAKFTYKNKKLILNFDYLNEKYESIIFYDKK